MNRIFENFFAALLVTGAIMAALCSDALAQSQLRIVIYGDSLTSGYQLSPDSGFPVKLERKLREIGFDNFEVVNMSQVGETTAGGLDRLAALQAKRPDIVIVELGANDAMRGIGTNLIHQNLAYIIAPLQASNTYIILMGIKAPESMGYGYSQQLDAALAQVATTQKVAFYPFALEGIAGHAELTLADGYHPNSKGVDVMVEGVYRMVNAGMRWKLEALRYQQEYQRQYQ